MLWLILTIIIVGALIIRAMNRNAESLVQTRTDDDDFIPFDDDAEESIEERLDSAEARKMLDRAARMLAQGAKLDDLVSDPEMQNSATRSDISFKTVNDAYLLIRTEQFLEASGALSRIGDLTSQGWTDKSIAKNVIVGRPRLRQVLYTSKDILAIREAYLSGE